MAWPTSSSTAWASRAARPEWLVTSVRARDGGLLDGWLVDTEDAGEVDRIEAAHIAARSVPLYMRDAATTRQLAVDALGLATTLDVRS